MTTPHRFQRSSPYTGRALVAVFYINLFSSPCTGRALVAVFYINLFSLPPRGRGTARAVVGVFAPPYTKEPISLSFISTPWRNARKGFFLVNLAIFAIRHTHVRVERAFFSVFNTKFTPFYHTRARLLWIFFAVKLRFATKKSHPKGWLFITIQCIYGFT